MNKEEIKTTVEAYNTRLSGGSSLSFVNFEDNTLKVKFVCPDKTEFLVQGKKVTMEDELKKQIEKYLKSKIANVKIIFE
ncbi:MAG: hypothetical protein WC933_00960 [Candidatus Paceibacterota bacterium]|jgi:hypothetical protein